MGRLLLGALLLAGCAARLGGSGSHAADDGTDSNTGSGSGSGMHDAAMPDAPGCASGRVVYLAFDGGIALKQAGTSDAAQNKAVWMGVATATPTKFRPNAADRATQIQDVIDKVKAKLVPFPQIIVTTTRPAAGPYMMVGYGDTHQTVNVPYLYAVNRLDCGDATTKSDLAWVFEDVPSTQLAADVTIGAILFGLGATGTNNPDDCMCGWLTQCQPSGNACTIGTAVTAAQSCPNQTNPQNEAAILQTFCQ
jgi:hypothetical protein